MVPVAVIIPYYNSQAYIGEALGSVLSQTQLPREIIVVDDGSADGARAALKQLPTEVRVVRLPSNQGPAAARNAGLRLAESPYVAFLDADDFWHPDKLATQCELMAAWPELDATHTGADYLFADGSRRESPDQPRQLSRRMALDRHFMLTPSIVAKRSSLLSLDGFDTRFRCAQDWDLQIRMVLANFNIQYVPRKLLTVRRAGHGNNSSNWRCFLHGHFLAVTKHRAAYIEEFGRRGWLSQLCLELKRAGLVRGGFLGRVMGVPHAIVGH